MVVKLVVIDFLIANIYVSAIGPPLPNGVYGVRVYHKDVSRPTRNHEYWYATNI